LATMDKRCGRKPLGKGQSQRLARGQVIRAVAGTEPGGAHDSRRRVWRQEPDPHDQEQELGRAQGARGPGLKARGRPLAKAVPCARFPLGLDDSDARKALVTDETGQGHCSLRRFEALGLGLAPLLQTPGRRTIVPASTLRHS